jgi:hypothetical protein
LDGGRSTIGEIAASCTTTIYATGINLINPDDRREACRLSACGSRASCEDATGTRGTERFGVLAAKRYPKRVPWSGWGMLVLAAADSYSRVYVGVHYPTDDLAGVVGLWVACG